MFRIGEDMAEKLKYVPGVFTVERHIRDAAHNTQMLRDDVRAGPRGCRGPMRPSNLHRTQGISKPKHLCRIA